MDSVFSLFSATENTEKGKSSRHVNVALTSGAGVARTPRPPLWEHPAPIPWRG